ncbi:hypothetical protein LINPERHAP1_LOCUS14195 [Linum perenne]
MVTEVEDVILCISFQLTFWGVLESFMLSNEFWI